MSDDPIRAYLDARKAFEQAEGTLNKIRVPIHDAATMLGQGYHQSTMTNAPGGMGFPMDAFGNHSIDYNTWPTAEEIGQALVEWHKSYNTLKNTYRAIPGPDQSGVQPPPSYR